MQEDIEIKDGHIGPAERRKAIAPILGEGQWPAQFDPRDLQKAGFLYTIKEPMFKDLKYKYQLETACQKHHIEALTSWKKKPVEVFRRWMGNVMAGRNT